MAIRPQMTAASMQAHARVVAAAMAEAVAIRQAHVAAVMQVLDGLAQDAAWPEVWTQCGRARLPTHRSAIVGQSGSGDGIAVLELVVLRGWVRRFLRDAAVVGWLAARHPTELSILQAAADRVSVPPWNGGGRYARKVDGMGS